PGPGRPGAEPRPQRPGLAAVHRPDARGHPGRRAGDRQGRRGQRGPARRRNPGHDARRAARAPAQVQDRADRGGDARPTPGFPGTGRRGYRSDMISLLLFLALLAKAPLTKPPVAPAEPPAQSPATNPSIDDTAAEYVEYRSIPE